MALLDGFRVRLPGPGLAAAVCGRLLGDVGASVSGVPNAPPLGAWLDHGRVQDDGRPPDLIHV